MCTLISSAHVGLRRAFAGMFDGGNGSRARSGEKASRARLLIFLVLTAVPVGLASTPLRAATAPSTECATRSSRELRVHLIDEAGVTLQTLNVARAEASGIWARVGLRLAWTFPPVSPRVTAGRSVLVVIRRELRQLPKVSAASSRSRSRRPLGWLTFGPDDRPGSLIEVSFEAIASLVRRRLYTERPIAELPHSVQEALFGRGLGRVIAHELGHWLMGRGHAPAGLMKSSFGATDLTDSKVPQLPGAWKATPAEPQFAESSRRWPYTD